MRRQRPFAWCSTKQTHSTHIIPLRVASLIDPAPRDAAASGKHPPPRNTRADQLVTGGGGRSRRSKCWRTAATAPWPGGIGCGGFPRLYGVRMRLAQISSELARQPHLAASGAIRPDEIVAITEEQQSNFSEMGAAQEGRRCRSAGQSRGSATGLIDPSWPRTSSGASWPAAAPSLSPSGTCVSCGIAMTATTIRS
jgi:hypothetical protein